MGQVTALWGKPGLSPAIEIWVHFKGNLGGSLLSIVSDQQVSVRSTLVSTVSKT